MRWRNEESLQGRRNRYKKEDWKAASRMKEEKRSSDLARVEFHRGLGSNEELPWADEVRLPAGAWRLSGSVPVRGRRERLVGTSAAAPKYGLLITKSILVSVAFSYCSGCTLSVEVMLQWEFFLSHHRRCRDERQLAWFRDAPGSVTTLRQATPCLLNEIDACSTDRMSIFTPLQT